MFCLADEWRLREKVAGMLSDEIVNRRAITTQGQSNHWPFLERALAKKLTAPASTTAMTTDLLP